MTINFLLLKYTNKKDSLGLSLIEVLIVIAIIAVLLIIALSMLPKQLTKARDAERKADLSSIKKAFEEYYNDNDRYPESTILENCGSQEFRPYLSEIPCDPFNEQPYVYVPYPSEADTSGGFRVYSSLENPVDPAINELNCFGGCGLDEDQIPAQNTYGPSSYNYGVSEGVPVSQNDPQSTPQDNGQYWRCDANNACNECDPDIHSDCVFTDQASCISACGSIIPEN